MIKKGCKIGEKRQGTNKAMREGTRHKVQGTNNVQG